VFVRSPAARFVPSAVVSLAATVLSWRPTWVKVVPGPDPSWQSGLAAAFERHLQWGPQVVFSFGPYGFVDTLLPFYRLTTILLVAFALVVSWGLAALVVSALRPAWRLLPAGVVAWAVLAIANSHTGFADLSSALALGLALRSFSALGALGGTSSALSAESSLGLSQPGAPGEGARRGRLARRPTLPATQRPFATVSLLGALTGFSLLTKWNDGLVAFGLFVVVFVTFAAYGGLGRLGGAATAGALSCAVVFALAWAGAGQSFANVPSYVRGSLSVAAGYSEAMGLSSGRRKEDFAAGIVLVLLGAVAYLAVARPRRRTTHRHARPSEGSSHRPAHLFAALAICLAGWTWAALKEGFVRHDLHDLTFFGLALVALALLPVAPRHLLVQAGAVAIAASLACYAAGAVPPPLRSPAASAGAFATDFRAAVGLGGFSGARSQLRTDLFTAGNSLPARVLRLVEGRTVAVEPWNDAIAFEYPRLEWDPEPVLQSYSAYTSYLDRLDASFLASGSAPRRLVYRRGQTIDKRDPWLDPPAALESMYCHYRQVAAAGAWQVLQRVPDRCGRPHLVGRTTTRFGQAVAVPRVPGRMLAATLSFSLPLRYGLEQVVLRAPQMELEVWTTDRAGGGNAGDLAVLAEPAQGGPAGGSLAHKGGLRGGGAGSNTAASGAAASGVAGVRARAGSLVGAAPAMIYRFIPGTAGDLHVLATSKSLGYAAAFTPPAVRKLALLGGGWGSDQGRVTVEFYAIDMRPGH
jgi:hypothetical protein